MQIAKGVFSLLSDLRIQEAPPTLRELALERLVAKLAEGLREPKARRPTRPTRAAKERRLEQKRRAGQRKRTRRRPDVTD